MRERHPFNATSFVVGLLALGLGALYLLNVSIDPRWEVDIDPVYVGGGVLLLIAVLGVARALAELVRSGEQVDEEQEISPSG
jgi:hypothetical protein